MLTKERIRAAGSGLSPFPRRPRASSNSHRFRHGAVPQVRAVPFVKFSFVVMSSRRPAAVRGQLAGASFIN
jgi:hypothetical protein